MFIKWGMKMQKISIHAPLRGRRRIEIEIVAMCGFQSTPPCGGDSYGYRNVLYLHDFNPRPLAGATSVVLAKFLLLLHFNPRPLAGAT